MNVIDAICLLLFLYFFLCTVYWVVLIVGTIKIHVEETRNKRRALREAIICAEECRLMQIKQRGE